MKWKYDGDIIFAYDDISDSELIENKLQMIYRLYPEFKKQIKFYIFCGFDRKNMYDDKFWINDIKGVFDRCFLISKYSAFPYVMRHENAYSSPYEKIYTYLASWANQPSIYKSFDFKTYCIC